MNKEQTLGMSFTPDQCGSAIECVTKKEALEAMDIYAKQEAIEFSLFFNRNFQTYMGSPIYFMRQYTLEELKNMTEWPDIEKVQKFTIEMIYNLFLEQR